MAHAAASPDTATGQTLVIRHHTHIGSVTQAAMRQLYALIGLHAVLMIGSITIIAQLKRNSSVCLGCLGDVSIPTAALIWSPIRSYSNWAG